MNKIWTFQHGLYLKCIAGLVLGSYFFASYSVASEPASGPPGSAAQSISTAGDAGQEGDAPQNTASLDTKTPIKHFIFLMQENHTFDNYFGSYPGADGIPAGTCMPVDNTDAEKGCVTPYSIGHTPIQDLSHSSSTFNQQWNNGKMDGFVAALNQRNQNGRLTMGYYTAQELPYYYNIADNYVLFDRFFSSARNGSFQNHFYWVAAIPPIGDSLDSAHMYDNTPTIFDRLQEKGISWKFYIQNYDPQITYRTPGRGDNRASQVVWAPILNIDRFLDDPALSSHIVDLSEFYKDLQQGSLPAVAYIAPSGASEHPPGSLDSGQRFVRTLIQELTRSAYWKNSAFMWSYDDWGGWYDHVEPPQVDENGYGLRVPALLVSAYARKGYVDHTVCDFTCIPKFIEVNWDLEPLAARDAADNAFLDAFNFQAPPRQAAMILDTRSTPAPGKQVPVQFIYITYALALSVSISLLIIGITFPARARAKTAKVDLQYAGKGRL